MALGMLVIGVLFQTLELEPWARVLCWAAVVAGSALTVVFGVRFVRQERDADH
jgi:negative regulator of sigma E activity